MERKEERKGRAGRKQLQTGWKKKKGRKGREWNWGEKVKAIKGGRVKEDGDRTIAV